MSQLFVNPFARATSISGEVLSGAKLYFYLTGTTTPTDVFTTSALSVAHANPVVADSGGLFPSIYLDRAVTYRAVLKTSADVTVDDIDPYDHLSEGDAVRLASLEVGDGPGTATVTAGDTGSGFVSLVGGSPTQTGYISFSLADGTRHGYVGLGEAGVVNFAADLNHFFRFNHAPMFAPGPSVTPPANGDVTFQLTSNTSLTFKAKGSDGVVRSGSVTLS